MKNCLDAPTPGDVLLALFRRPVELLVERWNWKSALLSPLWRGSIFLFANLRSGPEAALGAMLAEFAYRGVTAGFCGALTQAFRTAQPRWLASGVAIVGIPVVSHAVEFAVHWLRGTPNLRSSILASVVFTLFSTLFSLHAMRQGFLIVGDGGRSLLADFRYLPKILWSFFSSMFGLMTPSRAVDKGECL